VPVLPGRHARKDSGRADRQGKDRVFAVRTDTWIFAASWPHKASYRRKSRYTWKPALAEIEEALAPAFIIEELEDGRYTVFVPSVPTPFAGAVYILERERVHPLDIPFTQAVKVVSRWGQGSKELAAALERNKHQETAKTDDSHD
jgi:hypothetical protein